MRRSAPDRGPVLRAVRRQARRRADASHLRQPGRARSHDRGGGQRSGPSPPPQRRLVPPRGGRRSERGRGRVRRMSASAGNIAARDAAKAAGIVLGQAVAEPDKEPTQAILDAIQAAVDAVIQVEWTTRVKRVDPSCTLVSAVCRGVDITVGWVGDSRAYWFDGEHSRQLTVDDSFAEEGIAKGCHAEQAAKSPFLHSITHGSVRTPLAPTAHAVSIRPERPGRLVLCTDGLSGLRTDRRRAPRADRRPARRCGAGGGRARARRHRKRAGRPRQHHRRGRRHRSVGRLRSPR